MFGFGMNRNDATVHIVSGMNDPESHEIAARELDATAKSPHAGDEVDRSADVLVENTAGKFILLQSVVGDTFIPFTEISVPLLMTIVNPLVGAQPPPENWEMHIHVDVDTDEVAIPRFATTEFRTLSYG